MDEQIVGATTTLGISGLLALTDANKGLENTLIDNTATMGAQLASPILVGLGITVTLGALILLTKRSLTRLDFSKKVEKHSDSVDVTLKVHNYGTKELEDLEIKDFVPETLAIEDEQLNVTNTPNGKKLSWEIESITPEETAEIKYSLKAPEDTRITLPEATVRQKWKTWNSKERQFTL